jgi:hypothetical protein
MTGIWVEMLQKEQCGYNEWLGRQLRKNYYGHVTVIGTEYKQ